MSDFIVLPRRGCSPIYLRRSAIAAFNLNRADDPNCTEVFLADDSCFLIAVSPDELLKRLDGETTDRAEARA